MHGRFKLDPSKQTSFLQLVTIHSSEGDHCPPPSPASLNEAPICQPIFDYKLQLNERTASPSHRLPLKHGHRTLMTPIGDCGKPDTDLTIPVNDVNICFQKSDTDLTIPVNDVNICFQKPDTDLTIPVNDVNICFQKPDTDLTMPVNDVNICFQKLDTDLTIPVNDAAKDKVGSAVEGAKEKVGEMAEAAQEKIGEAAAGVKEKVSSAMGQVQSDSRLEQCFPNCGTRALKGVLSFSRYVALSKLSPPICPISSFLFCFILKLHLVSLFEVEDKIGEYLPGEKDKKEAEEEEVKEETEVEEDTAEEDDKPTEESPETQTEEEEENVEASEEEEAKEEPEPVEDKPGEEDKKDEDEGKTSPSAS
uniref:(California timema) hypothetical protein n=1 Tax=Timema californicum TaxID=61474 RepID=A0A7R9J1X2_TIMCA|nr:unnamed protein product [Timema californicum]